MAAGTRYTTLKDGRQVMVHMGVMYDRKTGQQVFNVDATEDPNDTQIYPDGFSLTTGNVAKPNQNPLDAEFNPGMSLREKGGLPSETRIDEDGFAIDIRTTGNNGSQGSTGPAPVTSRRNGNGVVQQGRNFSGSLTLGDATEYLQRSTKGYVQGFGDNWNSAPLPNTPAGQAQNIGPVADGAAYSGSLGVSGVGPVANGEAYANMVKNPQFAGKSVTEDGSLSAQLADKSGLKFDSSKYEKSEGFEAPVGTISNEERARRDAFLNAPDGLTGMKAVKAQNNLFSLGTKDFMVNNGEMTEISGEHMRDRLAGRKSAEDLKDIYVKNITESADQKESPEIDPEDQRVPGRNYQPGGGFGG